MRVANRIVCLILTAVFLLTLIVGCDKTAVHQTKESYETSPPFASFRDIPGITKEEILAIETLQSNHRSFVYGMRPSSEAFLSRPHGAIRGFSTLFCDWMTELFGISFQPELYEWGGLIAGLEDFSIDFTGDIVATDERREIYFMTDSISERLFLTIQIDGTDNINEIAKTRPPVLAFLTGSVLVSTITEVVAYDFFTTYADDYPSVYAALKNGEADAFIVMSASEGAFDDYDDLKIETFFPILPSAISLTTQNPELQPIISVMQKALEQNATRQYLGALHNAGYDEYRRNRMTMQLTQEELDYIKDNPVVKIGAYHNNYPVNFYNARSNQWQGIAFDVLNEVEILTGLTFEVANHIDDNWPVILSMVENGEAPMVAELMQTPERQGRFLWPETPNMIDHYALISKSEFNNVKLPEVVNMRVGLLKNAAASEMFNRWYPRHTGTVEYDRMDDAFNALYRGELDMVMASEKQLLILTHYLERPDYKTNIIFDSSFESMFGFNINEAVLCSIVSKTLRQVDTGTISGQWLRKTYDYRAIVAEAQRPWLMGAVVLSFVILALVMVMLLINHRARKQLGKLVAEQTATLTAVFNSSPEFMFCKDLQLRYTRCNKSVEDYFGIYEIDIVGRTNPDAFKFTLEVVKRHQSEDEKVIRDKQTLVLEEHFEVQTSSGKKLIFFETVKAPLVQSGEVVGILIISRDISERKEVEKELAMQTAMLRAVLDSTSDIILCKDLNARFTRINKSLEEQFMVKEADIIGKDESAVGQSDEMVKHFKEANERTIREKRTFVSEADIPYPDGSVKVLETVQSPLIHNGEVIGTVSTTRDISERKAMEENAKRLEAKARSASEAKSRFIANMSHEMRTPLNVVVGLTDLMLDENNIPNDIKENLTKINTAGNTLMGLINDVLDISKIEAGKHELMPEQYDVASLLNDIITLNVIRLEDKPITFKMDINEELPMSLYGDDLRVKQIANNLLSNAFKYTKEGTVTWGVNYERDSENDIWLSMYVSDTGVGIREDDIKKLFTDYNQVDTRANRKIEGTGLGLSITKMFVELMDGEISVESEYGKGTVFRLRIRQGFVTDKAIGKKTVSNLRSLHYADDKRRVRAKLVRPDISYAHVLMVDDFPTNLDVVAGMLRKYKMKVDCVESGQEAVDRIKAGEPRYDAIFMDHMMPGMDGMEATAKIHALGTEYAKSIPIIALTANAVAGNEQMFLDNGFAAYLSKPINVMNLDTVVQKWIRDKSKE